MSEQEKKQQIKVRYNETSSLYASQFIINSSAEDVTINFSSGALSDPASSETILPIHTRITMTRAGVQRLHAVLSNMLAAPKDGNDSIPAEAQAKLPDIQQ
jgi:hypothetical protein